jgi:hypothetical protein
MPNDPRELAALIWGGRTFLRSACPDTPLASDCFLGDVWKLTLGAPQPQWLKMSTLSEAAPNARAGHTANMLNGSMLIFGGSDGQEVYEDLWVFESERKISSGRWFPVAVDHSRSPGPGRRYYHTATSYSPPGQVSDSFKVLVFGGFDETNALRSDLWLLEISGRNATWSSLDPSTVRPSPRAAHSTVLYNSQIIVTGGQGNTGEGADSVMLGSWVFDIALERWIRRELIGTAVPRVAYHTQHYATGPGLTFIVMGASNRERFTNTIFFASTEKMEWSRLRPAGLQPTRRGGHAAAAWGQDMVIFGGINPRRGVNGETWWFFGQDLTWSLVSSPEGQSPMARSMHAYDRLGSYLLIHGGVGPSNKALNDMWSFHAGSSKWQEVVFPTADAPPARGKHSMTVVNERSNEPFLFVFGGVSDGGTVNEKVYSDAWIFKLRVRPTEAGSALCLERINSMGKFDGVNDVVTVDLGGALQNAPSAFGPGTPKTVPSFTLEAWILPAEFQSPYQSVLSIGQSVTIQRRNKRSYLSAEVCGTRIKGATTVYDATWHHVALVVGTPNGYPEIIMYIDEKVDVRKNLTARDMDDFVHASQLRIGYGNSMRQSYFYGLVDDVRLWSVARSAADIAAGMWDLATNTPGLEGWWQFDKPNMDGSVLDFSGKQRHGNRNEVARLFRPAIVPSTAPCNRPAFLSQKQLSSGEWTMAGEAAAAGGHRRWGGRRAASDGRPVARHSHTAIAVSSTRVMIHGGLTDSGELLADVWMFDTGITVGNPWSEVPPVSNVNMYGIYGHRSLLWQKHSLIGYGAAQKYAGSDIVDMMNINANFGSRNMFMKPLSSLPALSYFSLVKRSDDRFLAFGGDVRHHGLSTSEDGSKEGQSVSNALYISRRNTLEEFRLMTIPGTRPPAEYWGHGLVRVVPGLLCLFAGLADHSGHSRMWTYGVTAGVWTQRTYSVFDSSSAVAAVPQCSKTLTCQARDLARYGHSATPYSGSRVASIPVGSGVVVIFGGVAEKNADPYGDVTLLLVTPVGEVKVYHDLANTGESSPGGLVYHAAVMMDDMLLVHGGLRHMQYASSAELWAFTFGESDAALGVPVSGAWSLVAVSGSMPAPIFGHGVVIQRESEVWQGANRLWIVGGSACMPPDAEEAGFSACAAEDGFEAMQELLDMTSMYILEFTMDGSTYVTDGNGTIQVPLPSTAQALFYPLNSQSCTLSPPPINPSNPQPKTLTLNLSRRPQSPNPNPSILQAQARRIHKCLRVPQNPKP